MEEPREQCIYYKLKLERTAALFCKRGFEAHVFETADAARQHFFSQLQRSDKVAFGGSKTVAQLGLLEELRQKEFLLLDRAKPGITAEEKGAVERSAFSADVYLASANAVSEQGQIVNIDMWGNRTAAIEFGPKRVFLFVGRNKLTPDLASAIERARNSAAVMNCIRFEKRTPCAVDGRCHDCSSPERICSILSIVERSAPQNRIVLMFINEDLGF
jgi:hypothetical protein